MTDTTVTSAPTGALPLSAGVWTADKAHSSVSFQVRHLGLSNVRGRFDTFDATLTIGTTLAEVSIGAVIDGSSINTNQADRDAHLRGTDFFNVELHPKLVFASTAVTETGDGYELAGDLTINGLTQPVVLAVEFFGAQEFPGDGKVHAGFLATTEIRRGDFGINLNIPLGAGKLALGEKVKVELDFQFVAPEAA
jgi:polyisoprenoid-binding protein YceI